MSWNWSHIGSPVPLGVDFQGGTQVDVQFANPPDIDAIRHAVEAAGVKDATITTFGPAAEHRVLISLPVESNEAALDTGRQEVESALQNHYNNYFNPNTGVKVDVVGPTVGHQLEKQATLATLYSMLGMLIYLWFRFQLIYGVAAVVACFHDTLITVGAFAFTGQEISLTVIAAILTLVGYSMNDTIVVFDRIRENLRMSRRESLDRRGQSQHQPDPEPDRAHLGPHLSSLCFRSFIFGGQVLQRFLIRPGGRHLDRHLLLHRRCRPHVGGLAGLARRKRQGRLACRPPESQKARNMAAPLDFCIHSHGESFLPEARRAACRASSRGGFGPLKVAPVLQHSWQRERSSDKVYSLLCVDFPVGNNSPSRGV